MTADRKFVSELTQLEEALKSGWAFDPFLCGKGYPVSLSEGGGCYWVLVKGTPSEIAELDPFIKLPEEEKPKDPSTEAELLATAEDFVEIKPPEEAGVIPQKFPGWVIFKATKGNLQLYLPKKNLSEISLEKQPEAST